MIKQLEQIDLEHWQQHAAVPSWKIEQWNQEWKAKKELKINIQQEEMK